MKNGLLIINLGTPTSTEKSDIKNFLKNFLLDKYVIKIPLILRWILVLMIIIPFRSKKTAHAYKSIWTPQGSPLLIYQQLLKNKLQTHPDIKYKVSLGFRYGQPSLKTAINELKSCEKITILPLYPQYSSSATESAIAEVKKLVKKYKINSKLKIIEHFYQNEAFINAQASRIQPYIKNHDLILFSYHSIPENHLLINDCKALCNDSCNQNAKNYALCYRNQCIQTTNKLIKVLQLESSKYEISFQSRLGKTKWIKPYTDEILTSLRNKGIKKLAVTCPSFVCDCLETLEEINIALKHKWLSLGGESLSLIPALNDSDIWVNAIIDILNS